MKLKKSTEKSPLSIGRNQNRYRFQRFRNRLSGWWQMTRRKLKCILIWLLACALAVGYFVWFSNATPRIFPPDTAARIRNVAGNNAADGFASLVINGLFSRKETPVTVLDENTQTRKDVEIILENRTKLWKAVLALYVGAALLSTLLIHMGWRGLSRNIILQSQEVIRMKESYRTRLGLVVMVNAVLALLLYLFSYAGEPDITLRQLSYNVLFLLGPITFWVSSRFAAPMSISGKGCYFH